MNTNKAGPTLCIGVLTMNEERRIRQCLESAQFADQIVVVDSGSKDKTREIAGELNAEVYSYEDWQGFAEQRNRLIKHCNSEFVFFLDADEVVTPLLKDEILSAVRSGQPDIWETYWLEIAFGRPLERVISRKSLPRLFRKDMLLGFEGVVHEHAIVKSKGIKRIVFKNPLLHYSRETIHGSLRKLTQYAMLGAAKRAEKNRRGGVLRGLASSLWIFIRLYFFKRAILEGGPGFLYSLFIALEFFFRQAAIKYDAAELAEGSKVTR